MFEEQLRFLGVLSPEQGRLRAALMAAAAPHRERRAALSSALCDSDRAEGTAWSCVRGGHLGYQGKDLHQRAVGMEWAAQGSGHGPEQ